MTLIQANLIEGVFGAAEKEAIIEKLTDAMVSVEGEAMRPVTWVTIEEVASGERGIAGNAVHTGDVVGMRSAAQEPSSPRQAARPWTDRRRGGVPPLRRR